MGWLAGSARSEAQIEAEIAAEIEFHLEQRTRELEEQGLGVAEARAEAERRFGSVERVRRSCRSVQLGERIMLQRIQLVLNVVLATAVVVLGWNFRQSNAETRDELRKLSALMTPRAVELAVPTPNPERARFAALANVEAAEALGEEIAALPPVSGREALEDGWASVPKPALRIALLEPFVRGGGHAEAVRILNLAATDRDPVVRARAFVHLKSYAWQDFAGKPASIYQEWYEDVKGRGVVDALCASVQQYRRRLALLRGPALVRELGLLDQIDVAPGNVRGFDVLHEIWLVSEDNGRDLVERWLGTDDADLQIAALRFAVHFQLDDNFLTGPIDSALEYQLSRKSEAGMLAACRVIAVGGCVPIERYGEASIRLLRLCVEKDSPEIAEAVGAGVLARLWQLPPDPARRATQWRAWWAENRGKFLSPKLLESEDARWLDQR